VSSVVEPERFNRRVVTTEDTESTEAKFTSVLSVSSV
jgi:hypothetical protein